MPDPKSDIDEVHERIFISGYAAADCWETLQRCGITHILTVTPHARPMYEDRGIVYMVLGEVQDNSAQNVINHFMTTNAFIKQSLSENPQNKVLVHCAAGISRSGAFCAAYMIGEAGLTYDQALAQGQARRQNGSGFHPNSNFKAQLRQFAATL